MGDKNELRVEDCQIGRSFAFYSPRLACSYWSLNFDRGVFFMGGKKNGDSHRYKKIPERINYFENVTVCIKENYTLETLKLKTFLFWMCPLCLMIPTGFV